MNMSKNSMDYIHLTKEGLVNSYPWKGRLDLLNIVIIGLSDLPPHDEKYELHRLLCALFSSELTLTQKLDIIESEYKIPLNQELREDVSIMCNLGEGIREKALKDGFKAGQQNMILRMFQKGYTTSQIADVAGLEELKIKTIIEESKFVTA